jgi:PAS domain S-box-containing protein
MYDNLEVLHLEDNPIDAAMVRNYLKINRISDSYTLATNEKDFKSYFDRRYPNIVITDINVPGFSGFDALDWLKEEYPLLPAVVLTGSIDEETAAETIKQGAWDYVVKERLHRLNSVIENCLTLQRERTESAKARQLADNILQTTPSAVFTVDTNGVITSWNKMAETITGYAASQIVGKNCKDLDSHSCKNGCSLFDSDRKKGPVLNKECDLLCANGERKYIIKNADLLRNHKGEVIGGIESFLDQTEKIQMTKELIDAKERAEESDRLKSAFLANISHEIRTPLNAIIGFTDLVIDPDLSNEEKESFIKIIKTGSDQLLAILNNVLQIALIEAGKISLDVTPCRVDDLLSDLKILWGDAARQENLTLTYEKNGDCELVTDKSRLNTVLSNLIENAIKFSAHGEIKYGFRGFGSKIVLYVTDTGTGIPKSIGEKVFERFYRVNDAAHVTRGSGLGLSISKAMVEAMEGRIWHEPNIGTEGTTFYVELPTILKNIP